MNPAFSRVMLHVKSRKTEFTFSGIFVALITSFKFWWTSNTWMSLFIIKESFLTNQAVLIVFKIRVFAVLWSNSYTPITNISSNSKGHVLSMMSQNKWSFTFFALNDWNTINQFWVLAYFTFLNTSVFRIIASSTLIFFFKQEVASFTSHTFMSSFLLRS